MRLVPQFGKSQHLIVFNLPVREMILSNPSGFVSRGLACEERVADIPSASSRGPEGFSVAGRAAFAGTYGEALQLRLCLGVDSSLAEFPVLVAAASWSWAREHGHLRGFSFCACWCFWVPSLTNMGPENT